MNRTTENEEKSEKDLEKSLKNQIGQNGGAMSPPAILFGRFNNDSFMDIEYGGITHTFP